VGTFNPAIEIWNLDVLDPLEPSAILGGLLPEQSRPKMKKKNGKSGNKREIYQPGSHQDAVMALSWNKVYRQALASGSADQSVKIWDVTSQQCSHTFNHHSDKVSIYLRLSVN
jgi:periodic tryptophan protein 1